MALLTGDKYVVNVGPGARKRGCFVTLLKLAFFAFIVLVIIGLVA